MTDIELAPSMFLDKNDETRYMFAYFELNFFATAFWQLSFLSNSNKKASIITIEKYYISDCNVFIVKQL